MTKDLAQAAFSRDCRKDYKKAFQMVEEFVRSVVEDAAFWEKVDETARIGGPQKRVKVGNMAFCKISFRSSSRESQRGRMDFPATQESE